MASAGASCQLAKIFKILLLSFCVLFFFEYVLDARKTDAVYSSTAVKGPSASQPPRRTQGRHCFDGVAERPRNASLGPSTPQLDDAAVSGENGSEDAGDEGRDSAVANVRDVARRQSAEADAAAAENLESTVGTSDGESVGPKSKSDGASVAGRVGDVARRGTDGPGDGVGDATVAPDVGCDAACPVIPPGLNGRIEVNLTEISLKDMENSQLDVAPGGRFAPRHCKPSDRVAVVIPYRDREAHLAIFLNNMHPFLMKQQIEYQIYIVEQKGRGKFNRASLMNVGFVEANRERDWKCFIFHDVDLLPLDDRNLYTCPSQPRHLSAAIDKFQFKLPYPTIFGGVSALTTEQFQKVNGFSNSFWGWGGEDDDMANRINYHNYHISRYPMSVARYTMLSHEKESPNPKRYDILTKGKRVFNTDGLNSLQYTLVERRVHKLYTLILVELHPPS